MTRARVGAHLDGRGRDAGHRACRPGRATRGRRSRTPRAGRARQVRLDRARGPRGRAARRACAPSGEACDAGGPDDRARRETLATDLQAPRRRSRSRATPVRTSHAERLELLAAPCARGLPGRRARRRGPASISTTRAARGSMRRKSPDERVARDLGEGAGQLDAGRPAADDDEGQPLRGAPRRRSSRSACSKAREHPAPDLERVLDRLEAGRVRLPLVVAEVGVRRAGRDDQEVVAELCAVGEPHALRRGVDRHHLAEQHARRCAWRRRMRRIGEAMSAGDSAAVATW